MNRARFFVEGVIEEGDAVVFAPSDARKIALVLRLRSGDRVTVVDSAARSFEVELRVDEHHVAGTAAALLALPTREASLEFVLAQGLPKGAKMDFIVEKATELGAAAIWPLESERSIAGVTPAKTERWRRLARTAAQQCGRERVPDVRPPAGWDALIAEFAGFDAVLFPWELAEKGPLRDSLAALPPVARRILAIVGPEGGFSHDEAERAIGAGVMPLSLGNRILRTETAGLVLLSALLYERREL